MGASIECRGYEQVMDRYRMYADNAGSPMFSLFVGNELLFPYAGDDRDQAENLLSENLRLLEQSGSQASYKLRIHTELGKKGQINNNTPYFGGFGFKMNDAAGFTQSGMPVYNAGANLQVMQMLEKLTLKVEALENGGIGDIGENERKEKFVLDIMANPLVQMIGAVMIEKFTGKPTENYMQNHNPSNNDYNRNQSTGRGGMAGVTVVENVQPQSEMSAVDLDKLNDAVERLYIHFPDIASIMKKLADETDKNPGKMKMLLKLL